MAEKLLEKNNIDYKLIDAEEEADLTKELEVKQAPTLVVIKKDKAQTIANLSNIKKYIEEIK